MASTTSLPVKTTTIDGGLTLAYRELGSGPPVLLLHGWPTSSHLWTDVIPALAEHNRVLALDLPGYGASDKPTDARYDFGFFEAAIDAFLTAVGVGPDDAIGLVAHDIGGPIAVHWMLQRPGRVERLALLNTLLYPEMSQAVVDFLIELSTDGPREHRTSDAGLAEMMRLGITDQSVITDDLLDAIVAPFATDEDRRTLAQAAIELSLPGFTEIAAGLSTIDVPVRVVYGTDDQVLPDVADTMTRLAADVPQTEVTALDGCGHFLQYEAADQVAPLLTEFFAR